jgi:hypothetical protein
LPLPLLPRPFFFALVYSASGIKISFSDYVNGNIWTNHKGFHKHHLVGNHIRPSTAHGEPFTTLKPPYKNTFISPSSITATHVPRPALKRMIKQDYFGTTIPRYSSLS